MNTIALDVHGNEITIKSLAEIDVMSNGFHACKSLRTKRGGNPFILKFAAQVRRYAEAHNITENEVRNSVRQFIAENPMRYFATSGRLEYLVAA